MIGVKRKGEKGFTVTSVKDNKNNKIKTQNEQHSLSCNTHEYK